MNLSSENLVSKFALKRVNVCRYAAGGLAAALSMAVDHMARGVRGGSPEDSGGGGSADSSPRVGLHKLNVVYP